MRCVETVPARRGEVYEIGQFWGTLHIPVRRRAATRVLLGRFAIRD